MRSQRLTLSRQALPAQQDIGGEGHGIQLELFREDWGLATLDHSHPQRKYGILEI
uniref:Uncharacterized protein n=1 Tax=Candidatus Kentrum sp. UNK TaxID=2126344 RepID=A0A451B1E4_9GAMM|nr:MAG: hypothetical protein BECKUNK1418G_GA0071005_11003 [Candidatus Kentron sp. UNK]VFK72096.1 MAG: hypothetical protein BECKUNK1418H_GA0071006_10963 [Candidatus Kentron sp. UNK]